MTKSEIITKAQLYLDDMSELSSQEFSELFDKMYRKINSDRPWEGTKAEFVGTTTAGVEYVSLPANFLFLTQNFNFTDASNEASRPVVFRGTNYSPYHVVSWSDRRQYRQTEGYAYIDFGTARLYFTNTPNRTERVEFDYHKQMPVLGLTESPWFPTEYHDMVYHMMVSDDYIIQQSDKAKSYKTDNDKIANDYLADMAYWNSNLVQI